MKIRGSSCLFLFSLIFALPSHAIVMDFDDTVGPGGNIIPSLPYVEDGIRLRNGTSGPSNGLFDPDNQGVGHATDHFGWGGSTTVIIELVSGAPFTLDSLELGSLSPNQNPTYDVVGHFDAGGTISLLGFDPSADAFELVAFSAAWTGLASVDVTAVTFNGAIDTIIINAPAPAPEPATLLLLGFGMMGLGFSRRKQA